MKMLFSMRRKKAQGVSLVFKLAFGMAFFIAMLYILSLVTPVWSMIKESLGLGYSLADFEENVDEKYLAARTMDAAGQKKAYEEIVALWESFSSTPSASKIDPSVRTEVKHSYENLLKIYAAEMQQNDCRGLADTADASFSEKCPSFFKKLISAENRGIRVAVDLQSFQEIDGILLRIALTCNSHCKADDPLQPIACSNFNLAKNFCTYWPETLKRSDMSTLNCERLSGLLKGETPIICN